MNPNNGHQADTSIGGSQKGTCCLFQQNRDQQQWKQTLNHFWGSSSLVYTGCCLCVVYPEQALKDMMVTTRGNPASARDFVWLREKLTQPQTGGFVGLVFCWFVFLSTDLGVRRNNSVKVHYSSFCLRGWRVEEEQREKHITQSGFDSAHFVLRSYCSSDCLHLLCNSHLGQKKAISSFPLLRLPTLYHPQVRCLSPSLCRVQLALFRQSRAEPMEDPAAALHLLWQPVFHGWEFSCPVHSALSFQEKCHD